MSNKKRFIDGSDFNKKMDLNEFNEKWNTIPFFFNENGTVIGCPRCDHCQDGLVKLEIPDQNSLMGMLELQSSKQKMDSYLEKHIQKLINIEMDKMRPQIESKIREKYKLSQ